MTIVWWWKVDGVTENGCRDGCCFASCKEKIWSSLVWMRRLRSLCQWKWLLMVALTISSLSETSKKSVSKKWLLCCSCNLNENTIKSHIEILHKGLALYSSKYENFIVLGDFNVGMDNSDMTVFCDTYDLKCLIKEPTCYKNPENPSCIDLILTNNPKYFQSWCVVETGLSDFHRTIVTVTKTTFKKFEPRIIHTGTIKISKRINIGTN